MRIKTWRAGALAAALAVAVAGCAPQTLRVHRADELAPDVRQALVRQGYHLRTLPKFAPAVELPDAGGTRVPIRLEPLSQLIIVTAAVDGVAGTFLVDSGASATVLTPAFAERAGSQLRLDFAASGNVAGSRQTAVQVREARLGRAVFRDFDAVVLPLDHLARPMGFALDGIIGINLLAARPCLFDVPGGALVLGAPRPAAGGTAILPVQARGERPGLLLGVDGRNLPFVLDSGSSRTFLRRADHRGAVVDGGGKEYRGNINDGRHERVRYAAVASVRLGGRPLTGLSFTLHDGDENLLGMDFFQAHRVWIDLPRRLIWVTPVAAR